MLLVIDNYDSFTYNLVQYFGELGADPLVVRNDAITIDDIKTMAPDYIVLSPGPGRPEQAGITLDVIRHFHKDIPMLGVCLGHQSMGMVFGAQVIHAPTLMHGKASLIHHDGKGVFSNLPNPFKAARYHSLVIDPARLDKDIIITSKTTEGTIMGIRHTLYPFEGVQFHPESILTEHGKDLLRNFLEIYAPDREEI
jgi:para-aminobenzoate synthetase component 2